jgi:hypothetical protein
VETETPTAAVDGDSITWQFGDFSAPTAKESAVTDVVTESEGCSCTHAVGAGGAFAP